ncbi:MAG: hypothetical protein ABSA33_02405, partial [Candidatus Micrarchaeaceae archaeon]|jgi:hypothetical protein
MVDVDNKSITEPKINENKPEIATTDQVVEKKTEQETPKETQDQINWKAFRDQREKERKEKLALEQEAQRKSQEIAALKAAMEAIVSKPEPASQSSDLDETEEQRVQKQIKAAVDSALKEKEAREAQDKAKREAQEVPARLEQSFSDFNTVCSTENLDYLEYHHPEVAEAFKGQPDSFHKWANIYKAIKRYIPNAATSNKDMAKAEKNLTKPQSMSIPGMAATGDSAPRVLDDKAKAANYARMQRIMKGL